MQERRAQTAQDEGSAATGSALLIERPQPGIAVITMNRVAARNSLSLGMMRELLLMITELGHERELGAIVLAANGPAFSAGHDLKELTSHREDTDRGRAFFETTMTRCSSMMQAIVACPKPVIAAVQGVATAAGCQLVATCDLAVASETAQFCTPGVNIGLFCSTPMVALSRNVSRKHAMEMLLLGEMLPADKAAAFGLVNRVVPPDQVLPEAIGMAQTIAEKSHMIVGLGKATFYEQIEMPLHEAYEHATRVMVDNMMSRDAAEGIAAFLDKRKPDWKGH